VGLLLGRPSLRRQPTEVGDEAAERLLRLRQQRGHVSPELRVGGGQRGQALLQRRDVLAQSRVLGAHLLVAGDQRVDAPLEIADVFA
jgi:hypothetical protein